MVPSYHCVRELAHREPLGWFPTHSITDFQGIGFHIFGMNSGVYNIADLKGFAWYGWSHY